MEVLEINSAWWVIMFDDNSRKIYCDGPYAEKWHAESASRIRDI